MHARLLMGHAVVGCRQAAFPSLVQMSLALGSDGGVRLTACLFALPALASVFFFVLSSLSRVLTSGKGTMFPLGCPSIPQVMQP